MPSVGDSIRWITFPVIGSIISPICVPIPIVPIELIDETNIPLPAADMKLTCPSVETIEFLTFTGALIARVYGGRKQE